MGNAASCTPIISNEVVKVLFCNGNLRIHTKPVKAVELMVENPGEFVCDSRDLRVGQRIQGLSADDELVRRQFYFLLPLELLYSVLTQEEMSYLTHKASRALRVSNNFGKIFPVCISELCIFPSIIEPKAAAGGDSAGATAATGDDQEPVQRFSKQRSWKPALKTIIET